MPAIATTPLLTLMESPGRGLPSRLHAEDAIGGARLAPALESPSARLHDALKDTARGSTAGRGRNWARDALVVSQFSTAGGR
jgi:hypothetical protein